MLLYYADSLTAPNRLALYYLNEHNELVVERLDLDNPMYDWSNPIPSGFYSLAQVKEWNTRGGVYLLDEVPA